MNNCRLRITAQLINVATVCHFWSEKYERKFEDVFAIQDEIILAIVDKLKVKLLGDEKAALLKRHTANPEAYNLYIMGRYFWNKRTSEGMKRGLECFTQALAKGLSYARAQGFQTVAGSSHIIICRRESSRARRYPRRGPHVLGLRKA